MGEYIEREALMKHEHEVTLLNGAKHRCIDAYAVLEVPKSDVVEVRHGEWVYHEKAFNRFQCSKCRSYAFERYKHCPNCGAKMDGKGEGE